MSPVLIFGVFGSMVHEKNPSDGLAVFDDMSCWIPCDFFLVKLLYFPWLITQQQEEQSIVCFCSVLCFHNTRSMRYAILPYSQIWLCEKP